MPSATTRGASFCATLRDLGKRPFRETDCELFICKLLFNPIDTTSRRQHTIHTFTAPTTTPGRRLHWTAISLASRCTPLPLPDPFRSAATVSSHCTASRSPASVHTSAAFPPSTPSITSLLSVEPNNREEGG